MAIQSFKSEDLELIYAGKRCPQYASVERIIARKLRQLDIAHNVNDLRIPPGNRLEKLKGNRQGQYSIRVNDQWRICFRFTKSGPCDVEIVDYH